MLPPSDCTGPNVLPLLKNVIAPHFISELVADLGEGPFSLLIDESKDISYHDNGIVIY